MAKICICLTDETLEQNLQILNDYRRYADIAELRVDCLNDSEKLLIRRFPELANIPVILTIRRDIDGGRFVAGEAARVSLMARGLAYADMDRRKNFAYIDLEDDVSIPSIEEAARTFGTRVIRSFHDIRGGTVDPAAKLRSMTRVADEIPKLAISARTAKDTLALLRAGREFGGRDKILIAIGSHGLCSRILAERFGSFATYARPRQENAASLSADEASALGQFDPKELALTYRFRGITGATTIYGAVGHPREFADGALFYNDLFEKEGMNAVQVPFPADSIAACMRLADELGAAGLSLGRLRGAASVPRLKSRTPEAERTGACDTLIRDGAGWRGANTECRAFSDSLLAFLDKRDIRRLRATVIGAGGTARAVAHELHRLGARALILNRTVDGAISVAKPYRFAWGGLDGEGLATMRRYRDLVIRATPPGEDDDGEDPTENHVFSGKESVMDLACADGITPLLKRAYDAGCRIQSGRDMYKRQAKLRYAFFAGHDFPEHLVRKTHFSGQYIVKGGSHGKG